MATVRQSPLLYNIQIWGAPYAQSIYLATRGACPKRTPGILIDRIVCRRHPCSACKLLQSCKFARQRLSGKVLEFHSRQDIVALLLAINPFPKVVPSFFSYHLSLSRCGRHIHGNLFKALTACFLDFRQ